MRTKNNSNVRQVSKRRGGNFLSTALKGYAAYKGYQGAKSVISGAKSAYNKAKSYISPVSNKIYDKVKGIPTAPSIKGLALSKIKKVEKPKEGIVKRVINTVKRKVAPSNADKLAAKFSPGTELLDMKPRVKKLEERKKLAEKEITNYQKATNSTRVPERLEKIVSPSMPGKNPVRSDGDMFYDAESGAGINKRRKGGSLSAKHKLLKMRRD